MSDNDDAEGEEADVDPYDLKNIAIALAQQVFCCCSVFIFPALYAFHDSINYDVPENVRIEEDANASLTNFISFAGKIELVGILGAITAGVLSNVIGRKYAVIVANLSHLAFLIYSFAGGANVDSVFPSWLFLTEQFMCDFECVTYILYVAEITSPSSRIFFLASYYLAFLLFQNKIQIELKEDGLKPIIIVLAVATALSLLVAWFIPETPLWLTLRGTPVQAEETFYWLRAGNADDEDEFEQMVDKAEKLMDLEPAARLKQFVSLTFLLGVMFNVFLLFSSFNTCNVLEVVVHDKFQPPGGNLTEEFLEDIERLVEAMSIHQRLFHFYGTIFFFCCCLVIPRKVLLFVSFFGSVLIVGCIGLKVGSTHTLIRIASYCFVPQGMGIFPLGYVLPAEYFPMAVRDAGVVVHLIIKRMLEYFAYALMIPTRDYFPVEHLNAKLYYIALMGSLLLAPFVLLFMPETIGTHIYEVDELNFRLPFTGKKGAADEDVVEELE